MPNMIGQHSFRAMLVLQKRNIMEYLDFDKKIVLFNQIDIDNLLPRFLSFSHSFFVMTNNSTSS